MGKTRVNLQVEEDTKDDWDSFIGESGSVTSQAELVRRSVSEFIARAEADDSDDGIDEERFVDEIEKLKERLDIIENAVKAVKHDQLSKEEVREQAFLASEEAVDYIVGEAMEELNDTPEEYR